MNLYESEPFMTNSLETQHDWTKRMLLLGSIAYSDACQMNASIYILHMAEIRNNIALVTKSISQDIKQNQASLKWRHVRCSLKSPLKVTKNWKAIIQHRIAYAIYKHSWVIGPFKHLEVGESEQMVEKRMKKCRDVGCRMQPGAHYGPGRKKKWGHKCTFCGPQSCLWDQDIIWLNSSFWIENSKQTPNTEE